MSNVFEANAPLEPESIAEMADAEGERVPLLYQLWQTRATDSLHCLCLRDPFDQSINPDFTRCIATE